MENVDGSWYSRGGEQRGSYSHVQQRLRTLLHTLGWSYAALWTVHPHSRTLLWKDGYYLGSVGMARGDKEVRNAEIFYSTYKSCSFTPGLGCVGFAHSEGRHIWLCGKNALQCGIAREQIEFVKSAGIETLLCIPWFDSVLELGTINFEEKNLLLVHQIHSFLSNELMTTTPLESPNTAPLTGSQAATSQGMMAPQFSLRAEVTLPPTFRQSSNAEITMLPPAFHQSLRTKGSGIAEDVNQPFELNYLVNPQHILRSTSGIPNLRHGDMFLQQSERPSQEISKGLAAMDTDMLARDWRMPRSNLQTQSLQDSSTMSSQYRSTSDTPSSSLGGHEQEDACASPKSFSPSPEHPVSLTVASPRQSSPSNISSSPRSPSPQSSSKSLTSLHHLRNSPDADGDDIQRALSLMLSGANPERTDIDEDCRVYPTVSRHHQWVVPESEAYVSGSSSNEGSTKQGLDLNSSSQSPFKSWRHRVVAPMQKTSYANQLVLRRCLQMMAQIPQMSAQSNGAVQKQADIISQQQTEIAYPEQVTGSDPQREPGSQVPTPMLRTKSPGTPRAGRNTLTGAPGSAMAGHDAAAVNHMMAERRRRCKQRDNLNTLKKLLPVISKGDKASILGNAIIYLKQLKADNDELENCSKEMQRQYMELEKSYKKMELRNRKLEANYHMPAQPPQTI